MLSPIPSHILEVYSRQSFEEIPAQAFDTIETCRFASCNLTVESKGRTQTNGSMKILSW